jgi:hypothetical protein
LTDKNPQNEVLFLVQARVSRGWKKEMMNFLFERRLSRTSKTVRLKANKIKRPSFKGLFLWKLKLF